MTLSVTLPPRFLARDVYVRIERTGRRWVIVAVDAVGNAWPVQMNGRTDETRYASKAGAREALQGSGAAEGVRIFAQPSERF